MGIGGAFPLVCRTVLSAAAAFADSSWGRASPQSRMSAVLATAKADTAFKMIQAVRNQVVRAYEEIQQMRV